MDSKRIIVLALAFFLFMDNGVLADFWYNHPINQYQDSSKMESRDLKCVPGRTTIKVTKPPEKLKGSESEEENDQDRRRSHMNSVKLDSELCEICVCSAEGKDQYCTKRPAMNVNECLRMKKVMEDFQKNIPYEHLRTLAYRLRRDYIFHDDEIPYHAKAACMRSHSYYTNNPNANNTDIDQPDLKSFLDYSGGSGLCYYCVCSVNGLDVYCMPRDLLFCEYFRYIRQPQAMRETYSVMFKQDRPAYFRQLSWRLRRTMDDGLQALIDRGGDTMCCDHPSGHRRSLHNSVRNKVWLSLRRKVPKENLLSGSPGGDYVDFVVNNDK